MEYWGGCSVMSKHANEVGGSERKGKREKGKGKTIALQTLQVSPSQRGVDSGPEAKINIPVLVINVALLTVQTTQSQSGESHQRSALARCPSLTKMNKSKDGRITRRHSRGIWRRYLDYAGFCWIR
jgi:hypothetical protein